jgi:predicted dehydrogenase
MDRIKVGVVGVGRMGQSHCRVFSSLRYAELVGVCDLNPEAGAAVAQRYQVAYYPEVDGLLDDVDAVAIVTPTPTHFGLAMRCLERGIHVLLEKPMTETLAEGQALTAAAEKSACVLQVGHIERFNPAYRELKKVLQDMTLLAVDMRRLSAFAASNTDVDVILDLMIHDLDLALDLVGQEPVQTSAYGLTAFTEGIDHVGAHLAFQSGPLVTLTASRVTEQKVRSIEVTALNAFLETDLLNKTVYIHRRSFGEYLNHSQRSVKYRQESVIERILVPAFEPLYLEIEHFVDCIREHRVPLVTARDGLRALKLAETVREAARENLISVNPIQEMQLPKTLLPVGR